MRIVRQKAETDAEKDLVTGLIVSTRFCRTVLPIIKKAHLQVDPYKTIIGWVEEYFKAYDEAPGQNLEKIYQTQKEKIREEDQGSIELILYSLSDRYEEKESFNVDYYIDESVNYLKKRSLIFHAEAVKTFVSLGNIEEAEQQIVKYHKVAKSTSTWQNPYNPIYIENYFLKSEEYLMTFPGVLGKMLGKMKRKWLVGIMGPMKRGKTFWLDEFRHNAVLSRLKTVFISLEMEHEEIAGRGYKRLTGQSEDQTIFIYPVFDCLLNQHDVCKKDGRINDKKLVDENGDKPVFTSELSYKPCSVCRKERNSDYQSEVWYTKIERSKLSMAGMKRKAKGLESLYGDLFRIISHPINTVNLQDIERDLELLEFSENFIPDVIIIDYADILKKEDNREVGRDAINSTWKELKSMAQRRNCLVVTGTQSNRGSIDRKRVKQTDTGEDIRKLAHINSMIVLNQTPLEKRYGIMRVGLIAHRSIGFDEMTQVQVLQALEMGQTHLDSEILRTKRGGGGND